MMQQDLHPAIRAHLASIAAAESGDKTSWLALFAEEAWVQDPVGPSPYDPSGLGFRGKEAIEGFWDHVIGPSETTFESRLRVPSGPDSCACWMVARNRIGEQHIDIDVMVTYELDNVGKIATLRAFWDFDAVMSAITGS